MKQTNQFMRATIIRTYGPRIRGKAVDKMSDAQIYRIYENMVKRGLIPSHIDSGNEIYFRR